MRWTIKQETPLWDFLLSIDEDTSRSTKRSWIKEKRLYVGKISLEKAGDLLKPGMILVLKGKKTSLPKGIEIVYEDRDLTVLEKPAGVLSVSTPYEKGHSVHDILKRRFEKGRVYPVHRLDRDVSGLLVFANNLKTKEALKEQFAAHTVKREYIALVEGVMEKSQGKWESLLEEAPNFKMKSGLHGKKAITYYKVLKKLKNKTLLKLELKTGRKNQIRVHCSEAGHPLVGDEKYGASTDPYKQVALHAALLGFIHPTTEKKLEFTSDQAPF